MYVDKYRKVSAMRAVADEPQDCFVRLAIHPSDEYRKTRLCPRMEQFPRSLGTVSELTKVLALWLDGPPHSRSRQHHGYVP
jgi:hypothetical protein